MRNRLKEVRKALNLTQEEFGKQLGVRKSTISNLESGRFGLTDTMLKLVCRQYQVNEEWIRTGQGDMFFDADVDYLYGRFMNSTNAFQQSLVKTVLELNEAELALLERIVDKLQKNKPAE